MRSLPSRARPRPAGRPERCHPCCAADPAGEDGEGPRERRAPPPAPRSSVRSRESPTTGPGIGPRPRPVRGATQRCWPPVTMMPMRNWLDAYSDCAVNLLGDLPVSATPVTDPDLTGVRRALGRCGPRHAQPCGCSSSATLWLQQRLPARGRPAAGLRPRLPASVRPALRCRGRHPGQPLLQPQARACLWPQRPSAPAPRTGRGSSPPWRVPACREDIHNIVAVSV